MLLESTAEVPHWQVAKLPNRLPLIIVSSAQQVTETITMTLTQRSGIHSGVLHIHCSVLKEIQPDSKEDIGMGIHNIIVAPTLPFGDSIAML